MRLDASKTKGAGENEHGAAEQSPDFSDFEPQSSSKTRFRKNDDGRADGISIRIAGIGQLPITPKRVICCPTRISAPSV